MSFQFCTWPVQRSPGSTVPSEHSPNVAPAAQAARQHRALARFADELVEAEAEVQRDAAHRPLVLQEEAEVALDAVVAIGREAQRHRHRPAGVVGDRLHVAGPSRQQLPVAGRPVQAAAEAVRAGHVRRRAHERAQHREVIGGVRPGVGLAVVRLVDDVVDPRVEDRLVVPHLVFAARHARLIELGVFLVVEAEAAFEQQLVGVRARPLRDVDEAGRRHLDAGGLGRNRRGDAPVVAVLVLLVVVDRDLVLARHLPRDAAGVADDVAVVDAGLREVGVVDERRGVLVEVRVGLGLGRAPVPERVVEPDLVLHDRAADRRIDVPDLLDHVDVGERVVRVERLAAAQVRARARLQDAVDEAGRAAVVGLEAFAGVVHDDRAAERVAAVARHHVDAHAALAHFGRIGAGHVAELFEARVVPVDAAVGALRAEVVEAQAFNRLHRVAGAAELERRLLQVARAADVARQRAAAAERERRAGNHDADGLDVAAGRERIAHFLRHHHALRDVRRVDDGRFAGHRQRFFERADLQVGVDRGREVRRQLDAFADHRCRTRAARTSPCRCRGAAPESSTGPNRW